MNDISEIINYLNQIILSDSPDMIDFLIKYKQINEKVEDILAKPIKKKYNISSDDFPHELQEKDKNIILDLVNRVSKISKIRAIIIHIFIIISIINHTRTTKII